jgi:hypothetical protein
MAFPKGSDQQKEIEWGIGWEVQSVLGTEPRGGSEAYRCGALAVLLQYV